jgi:hypothetical protein
MTELLYTMVKCKRMADELSHFILSTRACGAGPTSAQSTCVGAEHASSMRRAGGKRGGACAGGGVRHVREACEVLSTGTRGTQHGHAQEVRWMARSVYLLVGSTFGSRLWTNGSITLCDI